MHLFVDENGGAHETVSFDGYAIADRLLEGVMIDVRVDDAGAVLVAFRERDSAYLEGLNAAKHLRVARMHAESCIRHAELDSFVPAGFERAESYPRLVAVRAAPTATVIATPKP